MASPFPFVKTSSRMGSTRYSVPTGLTKYHSYSNSLVNHSSPLSYSFNPRSSSVSRRLASSAYPTTDFRSMRASSESPFNPPTRHSSLSDPSFRFTMSRLKSHTLNHLAYV